MQNCWLGKKKECEKGQPHLVASEEAFSFQSLVWNKEEAEVVVAAFQHHTHGLRTEPRGLENT
jgi:hypothetical protein